MVLTFKVVRLHGHRYRWPAGPDRAWRALYHAHAAAASPCPAHTVAARDHRL